MSKFNSNKTKTVTFNKAGGVAYSQTPEVELTEAVITTFLDDKYYESSEDRISRIKDLIQVVDHKYVANLAVYSRTVLHLRSVSTLLIGELAKIHKGDSLVMDTIVRATTRVDDLTELLSYVGTPVPKQVKRGIRRAILKFDRYQLAKYKAEGKQVSLVDLFNLVHPKVQFATNEQKEAWKDLIEGNLKSFDTWETELSNAGSEEARKEALTKLIAEDKLGYMALIRNLNNVIKYNLNSDVQDLVVSKLTDPVAVSKSKQLPFRFWTAYKEVIGSQKFTDAIARALDISVGNLTKLQGKTLIAVDTSGSMSGFPLTTASVFASALLKSTDDVDLLLYDTRPKELRVSRLSPVVAITESIVNGSLGGGTQTSIVFQWAKESGKKYDRVIIISDNESWNEGIYGSSVQSEYLESKDAIGDPLVYCVDIQGYGTKDIKHPKVKHIAGWSDRILDFITNSEDINVLINTIKNLDF